MMTSARTTSRTVRLLEDRERSLRRGQRFRPSVDLGGVEEDDLAEVLGHRHAEDAGRAVCTFSLLMTSAGDLGEVEASR